MSKIDEIKVKLQTLGIAFSEDASLKDLRALLPADESIDEEDDGIVINDPVNVKTDLPLVVTLPESASKAQIAFAKIINAYAYQNPEKFASKKVELLKELREKKNAPDPVEDPRLQISQKNIMQ